MRVAPTAIIVVNIGMILMISSLMLFMPSLLEFLILSVVPKEGKNSFILTVKLSFDISFVKAHVDTGSIHVIIIEI